MVDPWIKADVKTTKNTTLKINWLFSSPIVIGNVARTIGTAPLIRPMIRRFFVKIKAHLMVDRKRQPAGR
ncbi:hypothetical protein PO124_15000 [Bacillus licheniformis]|nr:hypothetical protein [Bacillus licheniformis]